MLKFIQQRLALSPKGARDFLAATFYTTLLNLGLMLPAVYVFLFLDDYFRSMMNLNTSMNHSVWYYIGLGGTFMMATWVAALKQYRSTFTTIYEESANRRISLAEKLRKLPLAFFGEKNLSDLTSTIMSDATELEHTFSHAVPQLFASIVSLFLMSVGLFFLNWQLALALFWVVPVAAGIILVSKKVQSLGNRNIYTKKRVVSEHIQEGLDTIQEIKSYNMEYLYLENLDKKLNDYEANLIRGELLTGAFVNSAQSILKLGLVSVVSVGVYLLFKADSPGIDILTFLVFLLIASRIYEPISEVFNNIAALYFLDVRIDRMNEMEALSTQEGDSIFYPKNFDIEFDKVGFSYDAEKKVLSNVSFIAKQGKITALVGPSGGGKSTSAKLAARFWDIDSGDIRLGGLSVSEIDPETLLKHFSVVFQDVVLFNTSILDNIRIGRKEASDEDVFRAAKLAQCDEFIKKMPSGYHTIIGENGETLSGGERQRLSIARALLKDAPIVLLDEATASLDVENETKIQAGISELVKNKTVLIIAHRMRTIAHVDHVVVLVNGKVAESGAPKSLKQKNGYFSKMIQHQMSS